MKRKIRTPYLYVLILLAFIFASASHGYAADAPTPPVRTADNADDSGRLSIIEENDKFASPDDRHYTQGLRVGWLTGSIHADEWANDPYVWMSDNLPIVFEYGAEKRKIDWTAVGQSIFTPSNTDSIRPLPKDRPYGAWLYTGASMLQETQHETHDTLENFEVLVGVVGPEALGGVTQDDFHQFIGVAPARGWTNQLHTEPGVVISYERRWRFEQPLTSGLEVDAIPESGLTVGNIFTYKDYGGTVRIGHNLAADYGPSHIRPNLSGTGWFDPTKMTSPLGWYLFAGTQGRAVLHNIFLDGNTISSSPSVSKRPLVADFVGGASLFWANGMRVDFSVTQRTKEFYTQRDQDRFGTVGLTLGF